MRFLLLLALLAALVGAHASSVETPARLLQNSNATSATNNDVNKSNSTAAPAPMSSSSGPASNTASSAPKAAGGKKYYGSFPAPMAAPTTQPKKNPGGSFVAPVASPAAANEPVPEGHADTATDDDNTTSLSGGSETPGNSKPLAHHVYNDNGTNVTSIILPEGKQPEHWAEFLVILFTVAAIVLCGIAARRSCSKRRGYEEVSTTLIV